MKPRASDKWQNVSRSNGIIFQPTWKTLKYLWHSTGIPYRKQQGSFGVTQEQGFVKAHPLTPITHHDDTAYVMALSKFCAGTSHKTAILPLAHPTCRVQFTKPPLSLQTDASTLYVIPNSCMCTGFSSYKYCRHILPPTNANRIGRLVRPERPSLIVKPGFLQLLGFRY